MENISPELNYSPVVNNHSSLVYRYVSPQSGGNVPLNTGSSVGPTEFIIPPSCWIPQHTRLQFGISIAAPAAKCNFVNANLLTAIDRITVYDTATSNILLDCSNFHKYTNLVTPAATKLDEFLTKPAHPSSGTAIPVDAAAASPFTLEEISKSNLLTVNDNPVDTDLCPFNPYLGRRQFYISAATAATYLNVNIPFSALKLTALASDKIWYSPSSLVVQIYWSAGDNFAFMATAIGSPVTGSATCAAPTIISPQLILANEGNLAIVSQVINKVMSGGGIQLPIAYPTVVQSTLAASANHSFQYQLTRGYGNRILALITAPFSASALLEQKNYHPRYVTTNYNTFLNNVAIRVPNGWVGDSGGATPSSDYSVANLPYIKGSVIQNVYEYINGEWIHIDGFFGNKPIADVDQHQVDGLDVTAQSSTYQWVSTNTNASFRYFTAIIGQKTMSLTAQGVLVQ